MRLLVIGDVGGHLRHLQQLLARAGADVYNGWLPPDLHVIQVGDLIDRGPDSAGCVALVDRFVRGGAAWTQLFGNHEGNRLGARRFWDEPLDAEAAVTIRRWWDEGLGRMAVALDTSELGPVLVTHAGLVAKLWVMLGCPDCGGTAGRLNQAVGHDVDLAFASGAMLAGGVPGPAWADPLTELYPSWDEAPVVPFAQVHGHSPVLAWPAGRPDRSTPKRMRTRVRPDPDRQHTYVEIGGRQFVGVDPGLGYSPTAEHRLVPLELSGTVLA